MARFRVLSPDSPFPDRGAVEHAIAGPDFVFEFDLVERSEAVPDAALARADAVLAWHYLTWSADVIAKLPRCRAIMRAGVGVDHIDLKAAGEAGIAVLNTPDYGTSEVADHALALLLALRRGLVTHQDRLRQDPRSSWTDGGQGPLMKRIRGTTLGLVGLGRIGTATAERARGFGVKLLCYDPHLPRGQEIALGVERKESLADLLAASEVVSIHCPLTTETRGLMNQAAFAAMRPGSILINTARGGIVDIDACYQALRSGHLGGAGLDVLPQEPMPADHPLIQAYTRQEAWLRDRLILTPHAAWYSPEGWSDMRRLAVERLVGYLTRGDTSCVVNREFLKTPRT
jgi:phosphoglycerate dehydrogenase-like enzyme